jgi:predicted porin
MKKSLLALAALTAFAGVASAQSSVTLFGIVDLNARSVKNDTSRKTLSQDGIASSRLGFRGVEDLGGGLRAGFWLEAGINPDTGTTNNIATSTLGIPPATATNITNQTTSAQTTNQLFNRRSTVSLMGNFGEIRLGRDYTPDFWNHTVFDPFGTNGVGSSVNTFVALNGATTLVRANNSIGYFLPAMGGLYGQVMIAAGEGAVGNKHTAFRLGYAAGPVNVAFAYGKTDVRETPASQEWKRYNVAGSFNMGFMTLMAQYNNGKATGGAGNNQEIAHWLLGGVVPFGASQFKFSYVSSDGKKAISGVDASQIAVGYQYDLSKRTALYANLARISNDPGANYALPGPSLALGKDSTGYEFGIRHSF